MICRDCHGTGSGGHIRGCPIPCEVCKGSGKVISFALQKEREKVPECIPLTLEEQSANLSLFNNNEKENSKCKKYLSGFKWR
jgi:hypothetical protein